MNCRLQNLQMNCFFGLDDDAFCFVHGVVVGVEVDDVTVLTVVEELGL